MLTRPAFLIGMFCFMAGCEMTTIPNQAISTDAPEDASAPSWSVEIEPAQPRAQAGALWGRITSQAVLFPANGDEEITVSLNGTLVLEEPLWMLSNRQQWQVVEATDQDGFVIAGSSLAGHHTPARTASLRPMINPSYYREAQQSMPVTQFPIAVSLGNLSRRPTMIQRLKVATTVPVLLDTTEIEIAMPMEGDYVTVRDELQFQRQPMNSSGRNRYYRFDVKPVSLKPETLHPSMVLTASLIAADGRVLPTQVEGGGGNGSHRYQFTLRHYPSNDDSPDAVKMRLLLATKVEYKRITVTSDHVPIP